MLMSRINSVFHTNRIRAGMSYSGEMSSCGREYEDKEFCRQSPTHRFQQFTGGWGGFNQSLTLANLPIADWRSELASFSM